MTHLHQNKSEAAQQQKLSQRHSKLQTDIVWKYLSAKHYLHYAQSYEFLAGIMTRTHESSAEVKMKTLIRLQS